MTDQTEDRRDGMVDQATGKAKETWGTLTDDEETEAEGNLEQAGGRVKEGVADAKDAATDVVDDLTD
jgi:uncharacterized protein YjbJ (UPF0337 family)